MRKLETEENVEVPTTLDVSLEEKIGIKTVTNEILEKILSSDNMTLALKRVKANKGATGIDDNFYQFIYQCFLYIILNSNKLVKCINI